MGKEEIGKGKLWEQRVAILKLTNKLSLKILDRIKHTVINLYA